MNATGPACLLLLLAGCATGWRAGAPKGAIEVIAHRGASAYAPENTLPAFAKAIELGADWFELDCTLTHDGRVVVIHDDSLDRTTDGTGEVQAKTLAELQALDAGSWFGADFARTRLPSLEEALDLAKNRVGVYVEIKDTGVAREAAAAMLREAEGVKSPRARQKRWMRLLDQASSDNVKLARAVIRIVRERKMRRQVVIQSFCPDICLVALREAPELRTEFLGARDAKHPEEWAHFLELGQGLDPAGYNLHHASVEQALVESFHREGKTVAAWTVDDPETMTRLIHMGVDRIITNKPDVALRTLHGMERRGSGPRR